MFEGIHSFDATMDKFVVDEIHHALEHSVPGEEHHAPLFDMEHFHAFFSVLGFQHDAHGGTAHALTVGSPDGDGFTHQRTAFTCAVASQKMILDLFNVVSDRTGKPLTEDELQYAGIAHGWLSEHGTSVNDMGRLLDYHGVACHHGSGWPELIHDLAAGHQAIVALNADGLWTSHPWLAPLTHVFGQSPNHALVLKGLRVDEQGHVMVVVNDPGREDGGGNEYPLSQFQDALHDHGFRFVATDQPPPDWIPSPTLPDVESLHAHIGAASEEASSLASAHPYADLVDAMDDDRKHDLMRLL
jgi:hypothetical protein